MEPVTGDPPFEPGAVHDTSAAAVFDSAATEDGASGTVRGVAVAGAEAVPDPTALLARTSTETGVPLGNDPMLNGLESVPASTQMVSSSRYSTAEIGEP